MNGDATTETKVSFHTHLKELRNRLFVVAIIFIIASTIAYVFRNPLLNFLTAPLGDEKLYNITVGGQFNFIFQIMMYAGFAATIPFAMVVLYGFIAPSLPKAAQKKTPLVFSLSILLFMAGAAFGYYYAIPGAMRFLLTFAGDQLTAIITGDSYLSFILAYTIGVGLLFQIPLLMIIINWITPLKPRKLLSFERYVIVLAFIVAGLITPTPDAVNQSIIAAPVIGMYQVGFVAVVASRRKDKKLHEYTKQTATVSTKSHAEPVADASLEMSLLESSIQPDNSVETVRTTRARTIDGFNGRSSGRSLSVPLSRLTPVQRSPRPITRSRALPVVEDRQPMRSLDGVSYLSRQRLSF